MTFPGAETMNDGISGVHDPFAPFVLDTGLWLPLLAMVSRAPGDSASPLYDVAGVKRSSSPLEGILPWELLRCQPAVLSGRVRLGGERVEFMAFSGRENGSGVVVVGGLVTLSYRVVDMVG